jgi:outer membrane protein insertion porin family
MQFNRNFLRRASAVAASLFLLQSAWAVEPFTVKDIRVEGLQRAEAGTIFASLPVRVGDTYSDDKAAASIKALFGLGLFKDVRIDVNDGVLVVIVEERPTIADIDFVGSKEFDKDVLKKALLQIGLADGRPFDKALVDKAEQELKRQYINRSMYASEVITTVTPVDRNRVNLSFAVQEGEPAKISDIRIVGNKAFSESTLRGLFDLDTGGWLSWYTKSDRYARAKLTADLEALRSYYLARGYLEFKIDSTQVAISPNKQDIGITINVTEGDQFVVSKVNLAGNFLGKEEEFKSLVGIQVGQPYNADQVTQTTKAFTDYFGNFGYAFSRVEPRTVIDRATNRVEVTLQVDPSRRVYVRRINVAGNDRTRDEVIRREFRQFESSWYDGEKIKQSRNRVDRLGYFKEVTMDTSEVPGSFDQVDLTVTVTEKPTGSISLGAGVSSADGLGVSFGFKQDNAFGSGNSLGIEVNTSKLNRTLVFNTTNPYFTEDGVSRTLDVYQRNSKPYQDTDSYEIRTTGGSVRFGVPFTEYDTVFFGLGIDQTTIVPGTYLPVVYQDFANKFGFTSNAVPLTVGWGRDTRDSALVPTVGKVIKTSAEWSVAGELKYVRGTMGYQQYIPVTNKITAALNAELSVGSSTGDSTYPIFKNFYSGGLGTVRGFEPGSLTTGTQRALGLTATGGTKKINFNAELLSPLPGGGKDRTLRVYAFADAGGIYGPDENIQLNDMRASYGIGISWISPVGPLRLAFARPFKQFDANPATGFTGDRIQALQFQIGSSF